MRPTRLATALCAALASSGCVNTTSSPSPYVLLQPVLDSLFVGDQQPPPTVWYFDASGVRSTPPPGTVRWASNDPSVLVVDSVTGRVRAVARGSAVLVAQLPSGVRGVAFMVVSNALDITLLMDTVYAMPGDTLTVPVAVQKQNAPPAAVVWYEAPTNAVYKIDSARGLLTALTSGAPVPYFVHADTLTDTGAVNVLTLNDTTGGKFFFSVVGTVITHVGGSIRGVNYRRSNGTLAFRLRGVFPPSGFTSQTVEITLPDALTAPGSYLIDSLSPGEALAGLSQPVVICTPPRPWALWSAESPSIQAYSRPGGTLSVVQLVTVLHGQAISGHFFYRAQRGDLYTDPLGVLTVQGSFVAPFVVDPTSCP